MVNDRLLNRLGDVICCCHLMIQLTHPCVGMTGRLSNIRENIFMFVIRQSILLVMSMLPRVNFIICRRQHKAAPGLYSGLLLTLDDLPGFCTTKLTYF